MWLKIWDVLNTRVLYFNRKKCIYYNFFILQLKIYTYLNVFRTSLHIHKSKILHVNKNWSYHSFFLISLFFLSSVKILFFKRIMKKILFFSSWIKLQNCTTSQLTDASICNVKLEALLDRFFHFPNLWRKCSSYVTRHQWNNKVSLWHLIIFSFVVYSTPIFLYMYIFLFFRLCISVLYTYNGFQKLKKKPKKSDISLKNKHIPMICAYVVK